MCSIIDVSLNLSSFFHFHLFHPNDVCRCLHNPNINIFGLYNSTIRIDYIIWTGIFSKLSKACEKGVGWEKKLPEGKFDFFEL